MPIRGEATASLSNGGELTLKVNFATLARAAAQVNVPAEQLFDILKNKNEPRQMLAMLAMLEQAAKKHHPDIDDEAIGDLMLTDGDVIGSALNEAVAGAFGGGEDGDERNPPKRGPGTRSRSGGPKRA